MSYEDKIKEQAQPYLEAGEAVVSAFIARPRGATTAGAAGGFVGAIGGKKVANEKIAAADAGLRLANPMAMALTDRRVLVLEVSAPLAMGKGGDVKGLASAVPLGEVDSIQVKRLLVGRTVTVTVKGQSFKLEVGAGQNPNGFSEQFARAKGSA